MDQLSGVLIQIGFLCLVIAFIVDLPNIIKGFKE